MRKLMLALAALSATVAAYAAGLPSRYVQTEYIESSGDQWINTGYLLAPSCRVEIDFQMIDLHGQQYLFGSANNALTTSLYINGGADSEAGQFVSSCNDDESSNTKSGVYVNRSRRLFTLDVGAGKYSITNLTNGGKIEAVISLQGTRTKNSTVPLFLFTTTTSEEPREARDDLTTQMRLYSFKIYKNNELERNYVPCRDTVGDVNGLYETVEGNFYGNANAGASDFKSPNDPYVEANGKMPVNTGYFINPNSFVEVDFALVDTATKQQRIIACDSKTISDYGTSCAIYVSAGGYFSLAMGDTFKGINSMLPADDERHLAKLDFHNLASSLTKSHFGSVVNLSYDGEATVTKTANFPLAVFGSFADRKATENDTDRVAVHARVYRLTISEYDAASEMLTVKHDFVPRVKGEIVGFFDVVTGIFVTDEFNGLAAGGAVTEVPDDPCLVNDSDAYIDTGYKPTSSTRIEMDVAPIQTDTWYNNNPCFFGILGPVAMLARFDNTATVPGNYTWQLDSNGSVVTDTAIKRSPARRTIILDAGEGYVEFSKSGYVNYSAEKSAIPSGTAGGTLVLFARRNAKDAVGLPGRFKCYGCKIYEGGAMVRNYVPCEKDGIAGLWDTCQSTFLTSENQSGFYTEGAVREEGENDAYLESTGHQILSTGYFVNPNSRVEIDFALTDAKTAKQRILGTDTDAGLNCAFYPQADLNVAFGVGDEFLAQSFKKPADVKRHVAVYNFSAKTASYTYEGETIGLPSGTAKPQITNTANTPLAVFGKCVSHPELGTYEFTDEDPAKVKVFSIKIQEKENNVWVPKHIYLPCKTNGRVGLFDTLTGEFHEDERTTGVPFRYGGAGTDGSGRVFAVQPTGGCVKESRSLKLVAFAPGADSYQWYRDGVAIEGETGVSYTVEYVKGAGTATYQSKAIFANSGEPREVLSDSAEVTNCGPGLILILR